MLCEPPARALALHGQAAHKGVSAGIRRLPTTPEQANQAQRKHVR